MTKSFYDRFIKGFESSIERLPSVLEDWTNLDEDLQQEYIDQIRWMLENQNKAKKMAILEGHGAIEIEDKFYKLNLKYLGISNKMLYETGLDIKEILKNKL